MGRRAKWIRKINLEVSEGGDGSQLAKVGALKPLSIDTAQKVPVDQMATKKRSDKKDPLKIHYGRADLPQQAAYKKRAEAGAGCQLHKHSIHSNFVL